MPALPHQHRLQVAALYTLQHGLTRNTQFRCGDDHGHVLWWCLLHDARPQFIIDANLPRRTRCDLLAGDETICQPAVNTTCVHPENLRGLANRDQFSIRRRGWRLIAWDATISS